MLRTIRKLLAWTLCIAGLTGIVLWVRTFDQPPHVAIFEDPPGGGFLGIAAHHGLLLIQHSSVDFDGSRRKARRVFNQFGIFFERSQSVKVFEKFVYDPIEYGIHWGTAIYMGPAARKGIHRELLLGCNLAYPIVLLEIYPLLIFLRGPIRSWRRRRRGECITCAYDLTGNTTGICSECGRPVPKPETQWANTRVAATGESSTDDSGQPRT